MINKKNNNQHGFTLIEIIAAITLLGIVIIGFIPFFSNYANFTRVTEDKLTAINTADKIPTILKGNQEAIVQYIDDNEFQISCASGEKPGQGSKNSIPVDTDENIFSDDDLNRIYSGNEDELTISVKSLCQDPDLSNMYPLEIEVELNNQTSTKIYTYLHSTGSGSDEQNE